MGSNENSAETFAIPGNDGQIPYQVLALFALVCALPLALAWSSTRLILSLAQNNDTYSHVPLIPVISIFLIYMERKVIFSRISRSWKLGTALLALGTMSVILSRTVSWESRPANQLSLLMFGFVLVWMGAFALFFGAQAFRKAIFSLLFLLFAVPIPEPILSSTIFVLQKGSAETVGVLFRLLGIPVLQRGFDFSLPGITIRVAEECSGIRSTLALLIMTVLAGHLFLRSAVQTLLLAVLVFPLAIFKNALRIVSLSAIAVYINPHVFETRLHTYGGIPFFFLGLVVLGLVVVLMQRLWPRNRPSPTTALP